MDPVLIALTSTLMALLSGAAVFKVDTALKERLRKQWAALEFTEFHGQTLKHIRKRRITQLLEESMLRCTWSSKNIPLSTLNLKTPYAFAAIAHVNGSLIFVACKVISVGNFLQLVYEWGSNTDAIKSKSSAEHLAIQEFVHKTERMLADAELRRSVSAFHNGGSVVLEGAEFKAEIVRHILRNVSSVTDEYGKRIPIRTSLESRQNPWTSVVEAYISAANMSSFHIRFYPLPIEGSNAWELNCDWNGSLSDTLDPDSTDWTIVRSLFDTVRSEFAKAGAFQPINKQINVIDVGIFQAWSHQHLHKIGRRLLKFYTEQKDFIDSHGEKWHLHVSSSSALLPGKVGGLHMSFSMSMESLEREKMPLGWADSKTLDVFLFFQPMPPQCGQFILVSREKQSIKHSARFPFELILKQMQAKLLELLNRAGAHKVGMPKQLPMNFGENESSSGPSARNKKLKEREPWPTAQDYNESAQAPELCFEDPDLKHGTITLNALGMPRAASGAFACVYKVSHNNSEWALRCFNEPVKDQFLRYEKTSSFVCADDLPYTVPCQFIQKGIKVGTSWYPVVKMQWVNGLPLNEYLANMRKNFEGMLELRERFKRMMLALEKNGIAHGDLQHGNIIMDKDDFILIDYDNMYVPELAGFISWENGHRNYQHPRRSSEHFGPYLDNFSAWVIDTALLALAYEPYLWERFGAGDECLLFTEADFFQGKESDLFQTLLGSKVIEVSQRAQTLMSYLNLDVQRIPSLR